VGNVTTGRILHLDGQILVRKNKIGLQAQSGGRITFSDIQFSDNSKDTEVINSAHKTLQAY